MFFLQIGELVCMRRYCIGTMYCGRMQTKEASKVRCSVISFQDARFKMHHVSWDLRRRLCSTQGPKALKFQRVLSINHLLFLSNPWTSWEIDWNWQKQQNRKLKHINVSSIHLCPLITRGFMSNRHWRGQESAKPLWSDDLNQKFRVSKKLYGSQGTVIFFPIQWLVVIGSGSNRVNPISEISLNDLWWFEFVVVLVAFFKLLH